MIYDNTLIFSDAQAVTGDEASDNIVDLGATGTPFGHANPLTRDIGIGTPVPIYAYLTETFNNLTSLTISVQVDTVENFASPKEVASRTYALADLAAGEKLEFPDFIPEGANQRYLRLFYDVTGTAPTTGAITAGVVAARQNNLGRHYL
tara:strand:- start:39 stop:485 length:447 start_codon:yes stop_codon:yes gene_type:complete